MKTLLDWPWVLANGGDFFTVKTWRRPQGKARLLGCVCLGLPLEKDKWLDPERAASFPRTISSNELSSSKAPIGCSLQLKPV